MSNVKDITTEEFGQAVLQRSREVPVVVDFWAEWCGPCKTLGPALERVAADYAPKFDLVKVDVDANQDLARQFQIQGIPTVVAFKDGQPVERFTGALPESAVRQWVDGLLPTEADLNVERARDAVLDGDVELAEQIFHQVLGDIPDHAEAGTGLAALMIAKGEPADALIVLGKLPPTPEVERLQAAARVTSGQSSDVSDLEVKLQAEPADDATRIELATALAARAEYEPALDHLLKVVIARGPHKEAARKGVLDIFELLGDGHPLTATYRRELANALF